MKHSLPALPYQLDELAPKMSKETLEYHYGKHLQTYIDNLNKLIAGTPFEEKKPATNRAGGRRAHVQQRSPDLEPHVFLRHTDSASAGDASTAGRCTDTRLRVSRSLQGKVHTGSYHTVRLRMDLAGKRQRRTLVHRQ